jgi:hypothetical protein
MISFDLRCSDNHVFEGWFGSSRDFEDQKARGLLSCPMCGDEQVDKALMAPNVASKKGSDSEPEITPQKMMVMLRQMRKQVEKNADYVGPAFAEEARKIHYGEVDQRDIYGESTPEESQELEDEGIEFASLPWVPDADH